MIILELPFIYILKEVVNTQFIAIYIRVSSEEQVKGYSIEAQLEELRSYAAKHHLSIYREYVDAGYSGKSIDGRPAMLELLADARQNRFSTVITWKLNRLARNLVDQLKMLELFKRQNINYMSLTEQFDSSTPQGNFALQMLGSIAQLEREQIAENVRLGMQKRSKEGAWNSGNNVLGYEWVTGIGIEPHLRIVPHEAELVRNIFWRYRSGRGLKAITNQLNGAGYTTKRNKPFSVASVRGILTNVNYIGQIRYTAHQKFNGASSDNSKQVVQGSHEPIINTELWREVQELLSNRSRTPTKAITRIYPLTGLLKCPLCGSGMVPARNRAICKSGRINHMNHYYICGNYSNKGSTACKANHIPAPPVESETLYRFQQMLSKKSLLNHIVTRVNRLNREACESLLKQLAAIKTELGKLEKQQQRCFELFEEGYMEYLELVEKINTLKSNITALSSNKLQLESKLSEFEARTVSLKEIHQAIKALFQSFQTVDSDKRNALLRGFIESIHIPTNRDVTGIKIHGTAVLKHLIV